MQNSIKYHGYTARIDYDAADRIFVGRVLGMSEQLVFHVPASMSSTPISSLPCTTIFPNARKKDAARKNRYRENYCCDCHRKHMPRRVSQRRVQPRASINGWSMS